MKATTLLLLLLLPLGCARELPLEQAACPCASGWVCCESQPVCARTVEACPAPAPLTVVPASVTVATGRRERFEAMGADTWRVEEPGGGTIDAEGRYLAPEAPGLYHVVASGPGGREARAEVTVRPLSLDVVAGQYGGPSEVPVDGVGAGARFSSPRSMVMDADAVYVVDLPSLGFSSLDFPAFATFVRRVDRRTGAVETLIRGSSITSLETGNSSWALTDGPLATATFSRPMHLALDGRGHLFISELCLVRELDLAARTVRTVVGDPTFASYAELSACRQDNRIDGLSSDGADRLFVTRSFHHVVDEVRISTGVVTTVAGRRDSPGEADGTDGGLRWPSEVMFDRDPFEGERLYVADQNGRLVRSVWLNIGGYLETLTGPNSGTIVGLASSSSPWTDRYALSDTGVLLSRLNRGSTHEWLVLPGVRAAGGLAVSPERELWTSDRETGVVYRRLDGQTSLSVVAGKLGGIAGIQDGQGASAQLTVPFGNGLLAVSGDGAAWLADPSNRLIRKIVLATGEVSTPFREVKPEAIAADGEFLYELEEGQLRRAPRSGGAWEVVAGQPRVVGAQSRDGLGTAATFSYVHDLAGDGRGTLWIAEESEPTPGGTPYKLRQVRLSDGDVTTLLSTADYLEGASALAFDGAHTLFYVAFDKVEALDLDTGARRTVGQDLQPGRGLRDLAWDGAGKLYLSKLDRGALLQLDVATGELTTLVGQAGGGAVVPGALGGARLHSTATLATLPSGDVLVADEREHVLLVVR